MKDLEKKLKKKFKDSKDFIEQTVLTASEDLVTLYYIESLVNNQTLGANVIKSIHEINFKGKSSKTEHMKKTISSGGGKVVEKLDDLISNILSGFILLFAEGENKAVSVPLPGYDKRSITEPPTSAVLKGPREGFTEDINTNISLVRKRLKTPDLVVKEKTIGKYTNTRVCIMYIDSIADDKIVREIEQKLANINIDGIIDSFYIEALIEERKSLLFKQIGNTEKPDVAVSRILEGRILLIVDGSPIALTIPYMIVEDFQSGDDYYAHPARTSFVRMLRLFGLILAIMLPGLYVSIQSFHYRVLPIDFLITLMNATQNVSLPPLLEILFVLFLFEILNEASIRMPKYLGMALSIIGALILGETAVKSGIISSPSIVMVAISGITLYTVPDQSESVSVLRLIFTIIGGVAGFYGLLTAFIFLTTYLMGMDTYSTPYLAPYAPAVQSDKKDGLFKAKLVNMNKRPESIKNKNKVRMRNE